MPLPARAGILEDGTKGVHPQRKAAGALVTDA